MRRVFLLCGLDNPQSSDPRFALYPRPAGCTGARLCEMMGLEEREYLRLFQRTNIYPEGMLIDYQPTGKHDRVSRARLIIDEYGGEEVELRILALGEFVRLAFGQVHTPCKWARTYGILRQSAPAIEKLTVKNYFAWIPHPSGRNRWYNDPANRARAERFLRGVARAARREYEREDA